MGWSGHLILGVVYVFFLAQLVLICDVSIKRAIWIWGGPTVAIFFPLITSLGYKIKQRCKIRRLLGRCKSKKK